METIKTRLILKVMLLSFVLATFFSDCLLAIKAKNSDPNQSSKYLDAVREFADNVLKYGRDTYGPKHTPLFVDGLNIHTHEPVKWIDPNGTRWILSNLASQQNLFRTLDGLTKITGNPKYRQAAVEAIEYAFDNLRRPNGLLYWGQGIAYDVHSDKVDGRSLHSLKYNYPYYELMWEVDSIATKQFIEAFWSTHILDWSNLDMNRYGVVSECLENPWLNKYKGGPVFFKSKGSSFFNTGSDLFCAAAILSELSGEKEPLTWSKRLASRYIETRNPKTGISGYRYSQREPDGAQIQLGDDFKGHLVLAGTLFPAYPELRKRTIEIVQQSRGWICELLLGDLLGADGKEFTRWALEELVAWGKAAYRKADNSFIPMLTDGTSLEGYVLKKSGFYGPKGTVIRAWPLGPIEFWAYSLAYRMSGDEYIWGMARNIGQGSGFGDIGLTPKHESRLQTDTACADPHALLGFLELYKATAENGFLEIAQRIGDNILTAKFYKGFFVPSKEHIYARFDAPEHLALLHLHEAMKPGIVKVPRIWPSLSAFRHAYRNRIVDYDIYSIYTLTESSELPFSLHEAATLGDINQVSLLISQCTDIDTWDLFNKAPLHYAAMNGHERVVDLLLTKGSDINVDSSDRSTALHYAAEKGSKDVIELLIANGADINAKNNEDQTPVDVAVGRNHREVVGLLIAKGADISSIHSAAYLGDVAKVMSFIEGGSDVNARDQEEETPLHYAARAGSKEVSELLLARGADNNVKGKNGGTPLHRASARGHRDLVELLISKGADVDTRDDTWSETALHYAAYTGHKGVVELLITKGANIHVKDEDSDTPLHWAVHAGHRDVAELLIAKGADMNVKNDKGETALSIAKEKGHTEIVELLRKHMLPRNVMIANVSVPSSCIQGNTVPVTVSVTNEGGQTETFRITLLDTTSSVEIAGREVTLEPRKYKSATAADKIFTGESDTTSRLGQSVALGKDINCDGYGDMIMGAPYYKEIQGRVYIYYGGKDVSFDAPDFILTGEDSNSFFGHDIEMADFNNDNYADVAVSALGYNNFQGRVYVYYGSTDFDTTVDKVFDGQTGTTGIFGRYIAAGDINNDGCSELLVGATSIDSAAATRYSIPYVDPNNKGRAYLYYGAKGTGMDTICDLVFEGENAGDQFGFSHSLGNDVDGDGYGDLIIGTRVYPKGKHDGRAYFYYGGTGTTMDNICDLIFDNQSPGENFATDVDLFDIDNDGFADVIIAARAYNKIRGRVYIYWGSDRKSIDTNPDVYLTGDDGVTMFGGDYVDCGYVNNDAYGDIMVGAVCYPNNEKRGASYLFYGHTKVLMDQTWDMLFAGENKLDRFGWCVAMGDINGDSVDEILTGARTFKSNSFQGRAYLYYGPFSNTQDVTFTWDTTNASIGKHILKVEIPPVTGERNIENNIKTVAIEVKEPSR